MTQVIVDEALLREPNLWVPGKKPIGRVKIDWSHPLARGLSDAFIFNEGGVSSRNLVKKNTVGDAATAYSGATYETDGTGRVILSDASNECFLANKSVNPSAAPFPRSVCFNFRKTVAAASYRYFFYHNSPNFAASCDAANTDFSVFGANCGDTYAALDDGDWHSVVVYKSTSASSNANAYFDGNKKSLTTVFLTTTPTTPDYLAINGRDDSTFRYSGGFMGYFYQYTRQLSEAERIALHLDPYQFLIPA